MAEDKCPHGFTAGGADGHTFRGSDERKIERHERKCRRPRFVAHRGLLFWCVCCVGCRSRVV